MKRSRVCKFVDRFEEITCLIALSLSVIVLFINVILRYCFKTGLAWSDEAVRYLIIYVTMIGLGMGIRNNATIAVDLLLQLSSKASQRILHITIFAVQIMFGMVMAFASSKLLLMSWRMNEHTLAMDIPIIIPYSPLFIGSLLVIYRSVQELSNAINNEK